MSWLFGVTGNTVTQKTLSQSGQIHKLPLNTFFKEHEFYFAAGGFQPTCLFNKITDNNNEIDSFWIVLGCALKNDHTKSTILTSDDWSGVNSHKSLLKDLNGHYVFLSYENHQFEVYTDQLGLRTLYWAQTKTETVISSRIDWVAKYVRGRKINFESLGSRWLMFNQLSYDSLVDGIQRLGPSGKLIINQNAVNHSHKLFEPIIEQDYSLDEVVQLLEQLVNPDLEKQISITLGLSGGLDSRVLLSLLLSSDNQSFQTHTFGNINDPDVFIAERISGDKHIHHLLFDAPLPAAKDMLRLSSDFVAETNLIEPVSTVLRLRHYRALEASRLLMLDGGFGEIARRQYLNRLAFKGKRVIEDKNIEGVSKYLRHNRADFFSTEISQQMEGGIRKEIAYMLDTMPTVKEYGIDNFLDLWAVRTRLPNLGSDEQARLDSIILNYMPFAQPSVINSVFNIPVKYRRNGALFRKIIAQHVPSLTKYPLVKSNVTYPFFLSTVPAWLYTKAKLKIGNHYNDNSTHSFLELMKEFVLDSLHSRDVIECSAYDYQKISNHINGYYAGNKVFSNNVNWWLTFELWRRNIVEH